MTFSDLENCISSGVLGVGRCRLRHRVDRPVNDVPQERRRPMVALSFREVKTRDQPPPGPSRVRLTASQGFAADTLTTPRHIVCRRSQRRIFRQTQRPPLSKCLPQTVGGRAWVAVSAPCRWGAISRIRRSTIRRA